MKTLISVFPWANIGQNDHSNPYIESTTIFSDNVKCYIKDNNIESLYRESTTVLSDKWKSPKLSCNNNNYNNNNYS